MLGHIDAHVGTVFIRNQVHLKRLNGTDEQTSTEVVNARFVVGADGQCWRLPPISDRTGTLISGP